LGFDSTPQSSNQRAILAADRQFHLYIAAKSNKVLLAGKLENDMSVRGILAETDKVSLWLVKFPRLGE